MTLTAKLHHWLIVPAIVMVASVAQMTLWAIDRTPPFEHLSTEQTSAAPGGLLILHSLVRREISRRCEADFSRAIVDATGARFDVGGSQFVSAETIDHLHRLAPGHLRVAMLVPEGVQLGPASMVTTLRYRCNPLHAIWPINVLTITPFNIE